LRREWNVFFQALLVAFNSREFRVQLYAGLSRVEEPVCHVAPDLPSYLGMALALLLVAVASGYIPAQRASSINPMDALRSN
jgi:ABC-type lipoprotein release transport system permease subunit